MKFKYFFIIFYKDMEEVALKNLAIVQIFLKSFPMIFLVCHPTKRLNFQSI